MNVWNTLSQDVSEQIWIQTNTTVQQLRTRELFDIPQITKERLKIFFTGSYQLSMTASFLVELMDHDNNRLTQSIKATPNKLKTEVN